jgi:hypothetical protein
VEKIKTIETIFKICVLIAFISVLFDISVTYTFYKKDVNNFLVFEGNKNLVGELKEGIPFFKTISFWVMFSSPIILFFVVTSLQIFSKIIYKINLIMGIPLLLIGSAVHIYGGLSWWI